MNCRLGYEAVTGFDLARRSDHSALVLLDVAADRIRVLRRRREPPNLGPATNQLKVSQPLSPNYHGMLLEPVDYLVLLIGTLASTGWGFVLLGLS